MTTSNRMLVSVVLTLLLVASACATYRQPRPDLPKEDRGVAEMAALIVLFKSAARDTDFDKAYDILDELEAGVEDARTYTSSHPDFDEIARTVAKARPALNDLVERDRRARRAAMIAQLAKRMDDTFQQGDAVVARFANKMPNEDDIDALDDIVDEIEELQEDGEEFSEDPLYTHHLATARPHAMHLYQQLQHAKWIWRLASDLGPPINAAIAVEARLRDADGQTGAVLAWSDVVGNLELCVAGVHRGRDHQDYTSEFRMQTGFGLVTVEELGLTCSMQLSSARGKLERARWQETVTVALAHARAAKGHLDAQGTAHQRLTSARTAVGSLESCRTSLTGTQAHVGYDSDATFVTPFGRQSANQLRKECAQRERELGPILETLGWLASLESVGLRVAEAHDHAMAAAREADPNHRLKRLDQALGGFMECMERAEHLQSSPHRDFAARVSSPFGKVTVQEMKRLCADRHARLNKRLERVRRAASSPRQKTARLAIKR